MKKLKRSIAIAGASALAFANVAFADTTSSLLPISDGAYLQWTPSTGVTHYTLVDESTCNGTTDYVSTTTVGKRDSFGVSVSSIPNGSQITNIALTPCASRNSGGGGSSTMKVFYRLNGVDSADAGSYALTGTTPSALSTTTFSGLSTFKDGSTTLQAGAVYSAGTKGARLSRIATVVTYLAHLAPTSLTSVYSGGVSLSWVDNSAVETGFKIERGTSTGSMSQINTVGANVTTYLDTTAAADTMYYYRVSATNATADTSYSNFTVISTPPVAPSSLSATASGASVTLSWADNSALETGFKVERSTNGGAYSQIGTPGANATSYTDSTAAANNEYLYRVRAYNTAGNSAYSNVASTHTYTSIPADPSGLTATLSGSTTIVLNWSDNSSNEKNFKIERKFGTGSFTQIATVNKNIATYVNKFLSPGTTYTYRVRASNPVGDSGYSNEASETTP